jgi:glucosamine--fructose-6-phosphate aminotransferase (isomerizing)
MKKIPYAVAVAKQAEVLERNRPTLAPAARAFADRVGPDGVIGLMGIGASYYAGLSALRELWTFGRRAIIVDAGQLWEDPGVSIVDAYLAISASGESRETVQAIRALRDSGAPVVVAAVMAEDTGRLGSISDQSIPCADAEDSVPATVSYMGSLQALSLLVAALGDADLDALERQWAAVPAAIDALLAELEAPADAVVDRFASTTAFDFVADKDSLGSAGEGALLFREAPRLPTAWFDSRSYLHGPMESLQSDRGIVLVGDAGEDGLSIIARQAAALDCPRVMITHDPQDDVDIPQLVVPDLGGGLIRAAIEMVALQVLSGRLAVRVDRTSGQFRYPQDQLKLDRVPETEPTH